METKSNVTSVAIISSVTTVVVMAAAIVGGATLYRSDIAQALIPDTIKGGAAGIAALNPATDEEHLVGIIDAANDAVVSIVITKDVPIVERYYEEYEPFGGWGTFRIPRTRERGTEERQVGNGSGFIVSKDGLIVTNKHVVADPDAEYTVFLEDGSKHTAAVVGRDPLIDIAILRIESPPEGLPYLALGDSDEIKLGHTAIAIGNALGEFQNSVSVGIISGLSRSIVAGDGRGTSEMLSDVIQTDAAINPGNSGGPLLNSEGKVIGVNVATSLGADNISFALPINAITSIIESVKATGEIQRAYIGIRYTMLTPEIVEAQKLEVTYGALVEKGGVIKDSPGDKAGIVEGDIITAIDGKALERQSLAAIVSQKKVGDTLSLSVYRDGDTLTLPVTLEKAPENVNG